MGPVFTPRRGQKGAVNQERGTLGGGPVPQPGG